MSDFQFVCPFCDTLLDCPEELDGVETECPVCNKIIVPVLQLPSKISIIDENKQEAEKRNYERLKSELNELEVPQRDIPLLEIEKPIKNQSDFLAKCPACQKIIEYETE